MDDGLEASGGWGKKHIPHEGLGIKSGFYMPSIAFVESASRNDDESKGVNSRRSSS